jgi:hypothetical protein
MEHTAIVYMSAVLITMSALLVLMAVTIFNDKNK